ncbi:hypothetical protein DIZ81_06540 [Legionella taurinensis]|uniref:Uncharacterized protein n=1 Tax=Legionella taurinensis TaxID=70611 RepID=A0AB38N3W5_9GAMM|nr:hypothetical protein [Legionella taurinensis]MDX1837272.1 hypothetical protein [Legionella taurinensis]PUT40256.1 hypothetical protein DB744_06540 [Legionella taurinensis]PUT41490.1 hypothetical protein DB746_09050 [Legionella taurinensis]PUT44356.1 hypothetical protein DB743_08265 [Legionella taurinensis]PUT48318.1 hypothetical protein DB745_04940 [Legionella taurinensis]
MNLSNFTESDVETAVNEAFAQKQTFDSVEEAYQQLTQTLVDLCKHSGQSDLVLSRVYHSFDYALLPDSLQKVARDVWQDKIQEDSKLLVLMGTYGQEPAWQDRRTSQGHKAILLSHETLEHIPMVSQLLQQIGFDVGVLLGKNDPSVSYGGITGTFGVFYVSPALGSPYIPAQDFVAKYGVQSVIGTGVMLPQGDISAYIGFSRVVIEDKTASNIASLMSLFWQNAYLILEERGMFSST